MNESTRGSGAALTIGLCFMVAVIEGFDIQAMGVAAPKLAPEFGLTPSQLGWVFAISNIGLVIGASLGGRAADRFGRKPVFIGSVLAFGSFTLLTAFSGSFGVLFASRLLAGLGFGAALPNMMAVAAEISTPQRRSITASAMFCGMPLGGGLSALLTQVLPPDFDWRTIFIVGGILPLVVAVALKLWMSETLVASARSKEARVAVGQTLFGDRRAMPTLLLWLTFLPTLVILYLFLNWLPTLVMANGLDRSIAPQASLAFNFASVVGALAVGWMVDRYGARWPLVAAYALLIVVIVALGSARHLTPVLLLSGAAGFLLLGANYALYGVAASYYPTNMRGTGSGASIAVGRVGSICGPLLAGALLGAGATATHVVQYMAPVAAVACIAVFALSFFSREN
ncbi:MFS transporter [Povalibacter sp.]|uniref:MFS transporter n=1 Tax=Povalibacter sp. TaxID=1962978 RepID=UPI002F406821